jgi:hypothetical protein
MVQKQGDTEHHWTFLSNHAHVLVTLAQDPWARLRDVADNVGITERAAQRIVGQLEQAGVLIKEREGRRNHYIINEDVPLRHPLESHTTIGSLLRIAGSGKQSSG